MKILSELSRTTAAYEQPNNNSSTFKTSVHHGILAYQLSVLFLAWIVRFFGLWLWWCSFYLFIGCCFGVVSWLFAVLGGTEFLYLGSGRVLA